MTPQQQGQHQQQSVVPAANGSSNSGPGSSRDGLLEGFSFDESSGFWYNSSIGYYYDPSSQLFGDAASGQWYKYQGGQYTLVS